MRAQAAVGARFLDAPADPELAAFLALWEKRRGARAMPARADFDPGDFGRLLPNIALFDVEAGSGAFRTRLVGQEIVEFLGRNPKGEPPSASFTPEGGAMFERILGRVAQDKKPVFRTGDAYWSARRSYRKFEACFLPLSADGETVNMILGCIKFDRIDGAA